MNNLKYDAFRVSKFFITKSFYKEFARKYSDDYQAFLKDLYDHQRLHGFTKSKFGGKVYMVVAGKQISVDRFRVERCNACNIERDDYYTLHIEPIDLVRVGYDEWKHVRDTMSRPTSSVVTETK